MSKELNSIELTVCSKKIKKRVYQQLNGKIESSEKKIEERRRFWSSICGTGKSQNKHAAWLKELR